MLWYNYLMIIIYFVILFIVGTCLGSFLCCQARRYHFRTSSQHHVKQASRSSKDKSLKTKSTPPLSSRSICLHCGYQLRWYDNVPVVSWLALRGKCRECGKGIGLAELLSELGTGVAFLLIGTTIDIATATPLQYFSFIATILLTLTLIFLAIYDGLYGELPTLCLIFAIIFALVVLALKEVGIITTVGFSANLIWRPLVSVLVLGGLYLILYLISKGKWVGDGDWLLGTAIGLALYEPWLSLVTLFVANLLACLIMAPAMRHRSSHKIYFGPFLVIAYIVVIALGDSIIKLIMIK